MLMELELFFFFAIGPVVLMGLLLFSIVSNLNLYHISV
jgi:hypothetical protein